MKFHKKEMAGRKKSLLDTYGDGVIIYVNGAPSLVKLGGRGRMG